MTEWVQVESDAGGDRRRGSRPHPAEPRAPIAPSVLRRGGPADPGGGRDDVLVMSVPRVERRSPGDFKNMGSAPPDGAPGALRRGRDRRARAAVERRDQAGHQPVRRARAATPATRSSRAWTQPSPAAGCPDRPAVGSRRPRARAENTNLRDTMFDGGLYTSLTSPPAGFTAGDRNAGSSTDTRLDPTNGRTTTECVTAAANRRHPLPLGSDPAETRTRLEIVLNFVFEPAARPGGDLDGFWENSPLLDRSWSGTDQSFP